MTTISALEALKYHRYFYLGFQEEGGKSVPMIAYSDNLVEWITISKLDELNGLRDGFVKKIGNY